MLGRWLFRLSVPLLAVSLLVGCSQDDDDERQKGEDEAPQNLEEKSPDMNGPDEDDPHLENNDDQQDKTDSDTGKNKE